jgi:DNA-directed RNA polymerase specialized sigma24 family protein
MLTTSASPSVSITVRARQITTADQPVTSRCKSELRGTTEDAMVQPYKVFYEHIEELFSLAFILTGSTQQAEACFVRALDLTTDYSSVKDAYVYSIARRCVIKAAIGVIAREIRECAEMESRSQDDDKQTDTSPVREVAGSETSILENLLRMNSLRRAALTLRLFEKYHRKDMALLLGVTMQIAEVASRRALIEYLHLSVGR